MTSDSTHYDLAMSGISELDFASMFKGVLDLSSDFRVHELNIWDLEGSHDRTKFRPGTDLRDALPILEFEPALVERIAVSLDVTGEGFSTPVSFGGARTEPWPLLEGQVHLAHMRTVENPAGALLSVTRAMAKMAQRTHAMLLGLVDEDADTFLLEAPALGLPSVFAAVQPELLPSFAHLGAEVAHGYRGVWIEVPAGFDVVPQGTMVDAARIRDCFRRDFEVLMSRRGSSS